MTTPRHQAQVSRFPTEPKVKASTGAGVGAAAFITPAVVQIIDDLWLDGPGPETLHINYVGLIGGIVVAVCAWAAGWLAPHVDRIQAR